MSKNTSVPVHSAQTISSLDSVGSMLQNAHGKIPYNMTNDYMFRAVLQSNNKALRGLICSLLHLRETDIRSVEVTNPIVLGESVNDKKIRLDINVLLNDYRIINLEMQITNKLNWPDRSLLYLCRSFDNLNRGDEYLEIRPAIHIGFLDYTLFNDYPEFYATNKLMNTKNHHIYNDNFVLNVVDLSRIDLATEEDKQYHIDDWARLFKATTWEELKKMADHNEYLEEASKSIFLYNTDEQIQKMCLDRVEYYQDLHNYERYFTKQEKALTEKDIALAEKDDALAEKDIALAEKDNALAEKDNALAEKDIALAEKDNALAEKENTIAALRAQVQKLTAEKGSTPD